MTQKPLLIGQAPGPATDPRRPLAPLPKTATGGRLCVLMGLSLVGYMRTFDRTNLLHTFPGQTRRDDKWPTRHAQIAAEAMRPVLRDRTIILLGRNVGNAFGYTAAHLDFHEWYHDTYWKIKVAIIPHPSGRSHWYRDPANAEAAQQFWWFFLGADMKPLRLVGNKTR